MGRTQRKTSKYLELYRKTFKRKVLTVLSFTPPATSGDVFFKLFEEMYPDDVRSVGKHYQFYHEKNKRRRHGKPLYFPSPAELIYQLARARLGAISESTWNAEDAERNKQQALDESKRERERRKEKYRRNNISTQEVTPKYVSTLIDRYWKESRKLFRLYIIKECAKYKNTRTILFFRQIFQGEDDWFIRNTVFRILQRFDEIVYLPPKGKGKREKFDTLVEMFGCDYQDDIGKGPIDIMEEFYNSNYIQTVKDFDVFISHSVSNGQLVDNLVQKLNEIGLVAFVDWKSDREDLKRSKLNSYTADVLRLRMRQSKCLILIRTKESDSSIWVSWELGYFSALGRKMAALTIEEDLDKGPEFVDGLPRLRVNCDKLQVIEGQETYDFTSWLGLDDSEVEQKQN
jgi:hypothetical protein